MPTERILRSSQSLTKNDAINNDLPLDMDTLIANTVQNLPSRKGRDNELLQDLTCCVIKAMTPLFEHFMKQSNEDIKLLKEKTAQFDLRIDELEQYTRRDNVIIKGVAENENESTNKEVCEIAEAAGVDIDDRDISTSHRIGPKNEDRPRPIIVRFVRRDTKVAMLKKKKNLKDKDRFPLLYIDEQLSPLRNKMVRAIRGDSTVAKVWTIDGKINCTLNSDPNKRINITCPDDLEQKLHWSTEQVASLY